MTILIIFLALKEVFLKCVNYRRFIFDDMSIEFEYASLYIFAPNYPRQLSRTVEDLGPARFCVCDVSEDL